MPEEKPAEELESKKKRFSGTLPLVFTVALAVVSLHEACVARKVLDIAEQRMQQGKRMLRLDRLNPYDMKTRYREEIKYWRLCQKEIDTIDDFWLWHYITRGPEG